MRPIDLILRGLTFYWRTHLAVVLGVATAVAVLAGALLVGDSVRGSLRALVLERLGRTDDLVVSTGFFTEAMASALETHPDFGKSFERIAPLAMVRGLVTHQETGRRVGEVAVYGVDDRFWRFHGLDRQGPAARDAFVSQALADELRAGQGATLLVRVQRPTDAPLESLHGRKEDLGTTLRLSLEAVLPRAALGEFSLEPTQADVRAVFVPLKRLQEEMEIAGGRVNALLVARRPGVAQPTESLQRLVRASATLDDAGLTITEVPQSHALVIGSQAGLLDDRQASAATQALRRIGRSASPVFTYLANSMRIGDREVPYSLVSALDLTAIAPGVPPEDEAIVLNAWAARELRATTGDQLTMDYYVWEEPGQLVTRTATFRVVGVVPLEAGGRDLSPVYPGISDSATLDDWDPPFPVDLRRVRPADEAYWREHRTTPKAFIPLTTGQRLWRSRYGAMTSLRVTVPAGESLSTAHAEVASALRGSLDPLATGIMIRDVRDSSLGASKGATNFGEYFVYFSFFLVVSALLLAALFFKLGVEQRAREVGLLRAVGFGPGAVRRQFLIEGLLLAFAGSALGTVAAVGYAAALMYALRTWWVDAVGTTSLALHVTGPSLAAGAVGGMVAAAGCIWWSLRSLSRISERSLLAGELTGDSARREHRGGGRRLQIVTLTLALGGLGLLAAGAAGAIEPAGAFFGSGFLLMTAALAAGLVLLKGQGRTGLIGHGWMALSRLGIRYAGYRPGRSVLSMAVIASATFILIAVDAFRRDPHAADTDRHSGVGGYSLIVDTLLPVVHDPNTREGRDALNLPDAGDDVRIEPFRVRPGDDASCLNLYEPRNPRIVAPREAFVREGRFAFGASLAETDAERANPWLLLEKSLEPGVVPVIADANSMTYVLHRALGDEIVLDGPDGPLRLRLVGALRDSIFQGELVMSTAHFVRLFPDEQGYRRLLVESAPARAEDLAATFEEALGTAGADATTTWARLAQYHRVENTYLSTFQTLGGLGLLLGTVGLAAVLLRNVLERRRELALLGAVGYRGIHLMAVILAENALLLAAGLLIGAAAAGLAIAPAVAERGGRLPLTTGGALLVFVVLAAGLLSSVVAIRAATRGPLLSSLRSE